MKLNQIKDNPGARKRPIVVGRGIGSGKGKTSGRGVKGQKARTGVALKGFEGGQTPLLRRMPKRGFNNFEHATRFATVTLGTIQSAIDAKKVKGDKVDVDTLHAAGIIDHKYSGLKVIGKEGLKSKASIVAVKASAGAVKAIEAAGGKIDLQPLKDRKLVKGKKKAAK